MQVPVNDLLGGASLLLAVVSVLYGLWYAEIEKAIETDDIPFHYENRGPLRKSVKAVLNNKAVPLALASGLVALIFLPDTVRFIVNTVKVVASSGFWPAVRQYNAVQTAFIMVEILALALAIHTVTLVGRLTNLLKKINNKKPLLR